MEKLGVTEIWQYRMQCFKNRTGSAGPIGPTVDRPQNRFGSMQKTVFNRTDGRTSEPAVESVSSHKFFFFKLKRCRFYGIEHGNEKLQMNHFTTLLSL